MAGGLLVMSRYPNAAAIGGVKIAVARRAVLPAASELKFSNASQFAGIKICGPATAGLDSDDQFKSTLRVNAPPFRLQPVARRVCPLTGKKSNRANIVSNANNRTKKQQFVNLQYKRVWWEEGKRFVKLRLSTKALKTIEKNGLDAMAKKAGIDLKKK